MHPPQYKENSGPLLGAACTCKTGESKMQFKKPEVSVDHLMDSYKKGVESIGAATQMATETLRALSQLQTRFVKESFEELGGVMKELVAAQPQERVHLSQKAAQKGVARAIAHGNAITQAFSKSRGDMADLLKKKANHSQQTTD